MEGLDFIVDKELRKTIEDSIEFMYALHKRVGDLNQNSLYQEETCRVIILYVISIIEAILLSLCKARGEKFERIEFKFSSALPLSYSHNERVGLSVVVAVKESVIRADAEIGMKDLVQFFKSKTLFTEKVAKDILDFNDIRNTFHLSKTRSKTCDIKQVEKAFKLLVIVIKKGRKGLTI